MKLKIKDEKDLLRYVSSLSTDEGLKISFESKTIFITRYDSKYYIKVNNKLSFEKIFENENDLAFFIEKLIYFPIEAELY